MYTAGSDPVRPISLSSALKISLDNYYDLMKTSVGVANNEMLQLKLVADLLDISDDRIIPSKGGYTWFSYHNLLERADRKIQPSAVSPSPDGVQINAEKLSTVYGEFLLKLRGFVVKKNLSAEDQQKVADLNGLIGQDKIQFEKLAREDAQGWAQHCKDTGVNPADRNAYLSWSATWGNLRAIRDTLADLKALHFDLKTITDRKYPDPADRAVVDAEFDYLNLAMQASYPNLPDYDYPDGDVFNIVYLINLGQSGNGAFDFRYVINWDKSLNVIKTTQGGNFTAAWDQTTSSSKTIETDWGASGSGSYYFISARASASEHTKIQEDFSKTTGIKLAANAAFRINIKYPQWFHPELFNHKHVKANPQVFSEFLGPQGSLLYYPLAIVVVRGFSATFTASQNWAYDYDHKFSASAGGGFGIGPISFNASGNYSSHVHEHKVDVQNTSLTLADDKDTLRFIGYVLAKNPVLEDEITQHVSAAGLSPLVSPAPPPPKNG